MLSRFATRLAVSLLRLFARLPYMPVAWFGDMLGWLLFQLPSRRKAVVLTNLRLCFPAWDETRRRAVALGAVRHAVRSYVERSVQWFGTPRKLGSVFEIDSEIDLQERDMPPTIMLGFHFVGIEAASMWLNYQLGRPCGSLYTPMTNHYVDQVAHDARARFGAEMVSRADSARAVLRMLRERKPVMLAADMDYGVRNSTFVPFFGVPACTLTAVARLAKAGRAQVVPFIGEVLPGYRGYRLKVFKPFADYPSGDDEVDARRMNAFLEEQVLRMPEQYYWVHKRFKTRPPGEPGVY
jgi:KDO2-lipid IV(A) lauroyltransferase